jgi:hypothetical protein
MAAGLDSALLRFEAVIGGVASGAQAWTRSERRLSELEDVAGQPTVNLRYWVGSSEGTVNEPVHGSLADHRHLVTVELARHLGGADLLENDFAALERELSSQGRTVEHSLLHPTNWLYSTTGIVLVNHRRSTPIKRPPALIWQIEIELVIRVLSAAVLVP